MKQLLAASASCIALAACAHAPSPPTPYAGQESRPLKSLSADETNAYLEGRGQGFAKPAELNGYPGPMHVLELAEPLALSPAQREATRALMDRHKDEVRTLGRQFIAAEEDIERLFRDRTADASRLAEATARSANILARIRASHLATHVAQTALLSPEQVARYQALRGYAGGTDAAAHRHGSH